MQSLDHSDEMNQTKHEFLPMFAFVCILDIVTRIDG